MDQEIDEVQEDESKSLSPTGLPERKEGEFCIV